MQRRSFLAAAVVSLLSAGGLSASAPSSPLRKLERWTGNKWEVCRMKDLREFDRFRLQDLAGEWMATSKPYYDAYPDYCGWSIHAAPAGEMPREQQ